VRGRSPQGLLDHRRRLVDFSLWTRWPGAPRADRCGRLGPPGVSLERRRPHELLPIIHGLAGHFDREQIHKFIHDKKVIALWEIETDEFALYVNMIRGLGT
jgi:hypothetical protein